GLTAIGVAQIREDAAVFSLEFFDRIKRSAAHQAGDRRVQSPARDEQQREAGAGLLVLDANAAFFVERHGSSSLFSLLQTLAALRPSPFRRHPFSVLWRSEGSGRSEGSVLNK